MKRSSLMNSVATLAAVAIWGSMGGAAFAQSKKLPPGAVNDKKVEVGYGLDKDQPFAGADPDGTGLPFKEPPPAAVEAAMCETFVPQFPQILQHGAVRAVSGVFID